MSENQSSWPATPPPAPGRDRADVVPPAVYAHPGHPQSAHPQSAHPQPAHLQPGHAQPAYPAAAGPQPVPVFARQPAGYIPAPARPPSGLFPGPTRPVYREPHPVAAAPVLSGFGATLLWFGLFGGLAHDLAAYAWWTLVAAITAWAVAILLTVLGDRGAAVGIALASGLGLSIAMAFVGARWIATYDWPLW